LKSLKKATKFEPNKAIAMSQGIQAKPGYRYQAEDISFDSGVYIS
jgi:hypothetical protein